MCSLLFLLFTQNPAQFLNIILRKISLSHEMQNRFGRRPTKDPIHKRLTFPTGTFLNRNNGSIKIAFPFQFLP